MSLKQVTTPEKNVRVIEFTIAKEIFDSAVNRVYKKNVTKMNVPGFRRGKAPRSIIEKMYGKGVFYEEALNEVIPDAYTEALKESALDVVSRPEFDVETIDDDGVLMKAKVYVKPEVTIGVYKKIPVEKVLVEVKDEEVQAEIDRVRQRNARTIDVTDRPAAMGDTVIIDFDGSVDGVPFDGGKAEKYSLKLGSGQFIPGFEEQIVGKQKGDAFDVNVTFPEEYHAEDLAGKASVFKVVLHEIKFDELPDSDDEFAKDVSEFDTLDEYKADIRAKMEERNAKTAENHIEEQLINALIEGMEADIPDAMIENEVENQVRDYDNRLRQQGLDLNTYFKYTGMTLDSLREQFKPQAERQVKTRLALEKIVEIEAIEATEDEIDEDYKKIAEAYHMELEQIRQAIDAESVAKDIKVKKAVDLVKENAIITEKTEAEKAAEEKQADDSASGTDTEEKKADAEQNAKPAKRTRKSKKATDEESTEA